MRGSQDGLSRDNKDKKTPSNLRIKRTAWVRDREKRNSPDMMIPLYVIDMVKGISMSF